MPTLSKSLTSTIAKSSKDCPAPPKGYVIYWDKAGDGFGCRVSGTGDRAWITERRVNGKTVRRTLGKAEGRGEISADAARKKVREVSDELALGFDRNEVERAKDKAKAADERANRYTLAKALEEYVKGKRRGKDGLELKARTRSDYLAMVEPGRTLLSGKPTADGELYPLASKPITKITGDEIRTLYARLEKHSARRATYAMQVLRAVLNWNGTQVPGNPLGKAVAGRDRIVLKSTVGKPSPIPPERLGIWWRCALRAAGDEIGGSAEAADYLRFQLLTGCRGVEIHGDAYGNEPIRVRDVDLAGGRIQLTDTKNRRDHTLLLSSQALAIVKHRIEGKKPHAPLFDVVDARKTLRAINQGSGVRIGGHDLRATFASVAEDLVSHYVLKRMLNHADGGDVTGGHYVGKSEAQLRAGWQAVADLIESLANEPSTDGEKDGTVVPIRQRRKSAA